MTIKASATNKMEKKYKKADKDKCSSGETVTLVLLLSLSDSFAELSILFHSATKHSHVYHLKPETQYHFKNYIVIPIEYMPS